MKRVLIWAIKAYQKYIPNQNKRCCLYKESCSQYALRVLAQKGFFGGVAATFSRILSCRPGYKVVASGREIGIRLRNGDYVDESSASPSLIMPYRNTLESYSSETETVSHNHTMRH